MANLYIESGLDPKNLQNSFEKKLKYTNESYTQSVDNGSYKNFIHDRAGYGLAQWSYYSRKEKLLNYAKKNKKSIGDLYIQLDFLLTELESYNLIKLLKTTNSVKKATVEVMLKFERPADQSKSAQKKRTSYGESFYNKYSKNKKIIKQTGENNMKYNTKNKPLVCMQTNSTCYKGTQPMQILGVLWHSTGANNPNLKRYVQPSDDDPNKKQLLKLIGENTSKNDWNHIYRKAGLNAWIGLLANGEVASIQTMPWNFRPWGCGSGSKGSCNNGWIQFEICEDRLDDKKYFEKVYKEACELTAYLCKMYNLDPKGTVNMNGIKVPVILCHSDSYKLGFGNNHGDILHWFSKYGKTMKDIRNDIAQIINNSPKAEVILPEEEEMTQEQFNIMMNNWIAEQAKKPASDWSKEFRDWGEKNNLVSGDTNGDMMYKKFLTREEFITVLYRALHRNIMD